MKILLFGGNGFLGNALCLLLKERNIDFYTTSRSNKKSDFKIDISDYEDFKTLPQNFFDVVINCATILPGGHYLDSDYLNKIYKTNILGTQNICKWINNQQSIKKIINCSTLAVVRKPWALNLSEDSNTYPIGNHVLYCSSKLTQELLFKTLAVSKNIVLTQIRFSSLYGTTMNWNGIICNLIDQSRKTEKMNLTNALKVSADFLHVKDASKIILETIKNDINGILNAASGVEITILKLAELIKKIISKNIEIENIEIENFITDRAVINIDRLKKIIDINSFVDLETGINEIINL